MALRLRQSDTGRHGPLPRLLGELDEQSSATGRAYVAVFAVLPYEMFRMPAAYSSVPGLKDPHPGVLAFARARPLAVSASGGDRSAGRFDGSQACGTSDRALARAARQAGSRNDNRTTNAGQRVGGRIPARRRRRARRFGASGYHPGWVASGRNSAEFLDFSAGATDQRRGSASFACVPGSFA